MNKAFCFTAFCAAYSQIQPGNWCRQDLQDYSARVPAVLLSLQRNLLSFGYMNPYVCPADIILFSMSMSVTLCATASVLPLNPGSAFGITAIVH